MTSVKLLSVNCDVSEDTHDEVQEVSCKNKPLNSTIVSEVTCAKDSCSNSKDKISSSTNKVDSSHVSKKKKKRRKKKISSNSSTTDSNVICNEASGSSSKDNNFEIRNASNQVLSTATTTNGISKKMTNSSTMDSSASCNEDDCSNLGDCKNSGDFIKIQSPETTTRNSSPKRVADNSTIDSDVTYKAVDSNSNEKGDITIIKTPNKVLSSKILSNSSSKKIRGNSTINSDVTCKAVDPKSNEEGDFTIIKTPNKVISSKILSIRSSKKIREKPTIESDLTCKAIDSNSDEEGDITIIKTPNKVLSSKIPGNGCLQCRKMSCLCSYGNDDQSTVISAPDKSSKRIINAAAFCREASCSISDYYNRKKSNYDGRNDQPTINSAATWNEASYLNSDYSTQKDGNCNWKTDQPSIDSGATWNEVSCSNSNYDTWKKNNKFTWMTDNSNIDSAATFNKASCSNSISGSWDDIENIDWHKQSEKSSAVPLTMKDLIQHLKFILEQYKIAYDSYWKFENDESFDIRFEFWKVQSKFTFNILRFGRDMEEALSYIRISHPTTIRAVADNLVQLLFASSTDVSEIQEFIKIHAENVRLTVLLNDLEQRYEILKSIFSNFMNVIFEFNNQYYYH